MRETHGGDRLVPMAEPKGSPRHCVSAGEWFEDVQNRNSPFSRRGADSFASSVISSSPFGEFMVMGTLLWELAWVWCEQAAGRTQATTHPLARERLMDFIRANAAVAAELGIDERRIGEFLPQAEQVRMVTWKTNRNARNYEINW